MNALTKSIRADGKKVTANTIQHAKAVYNLIGYNNEMLVRAAISDLHKINPSKDMDNIIPWYHHYDSASLFAIIPYIILIMNLLSANILHQFFILGIPIICYLISRYIILPRLHLSFWLRIVYWIFSGLFIAGIYYCFHERTDPVTVISLLLGIFSSILITHAKPKTKVIKDEKS
jgi:hypothetical protein